MITKAQLEENGFRSLGGHIYYYDVYDFCFNIRTQSIYAINELDGEEEFLCKVTDVNKLKDLMETIK